MNEMNGLIKLLSQHTTEFKSSMGEEKKGPTTSPSRITLQEQMKRDKGKKDIKFKDHKIPNNRFPTALLPPKNEI